MMSYRAKEEIYDLYVTNISRVTKNHNELAIELMEFINQGVKEEMQESNFGYVVCEKIPKTLSEAKYDSIKTCIGFVRFEKHRNHNLAAKWLNDVLFYNKPLKVVVNSLPTSAAQWPWTDKDYRGKTGTVHRNKEKLFASPNNQVYTVMNVLQPNLGSHQTVTVPNETNVTETPNEVIESKPDRDKIQELDSILDEYKTKTLSILIEERKKRESAERKSFESQDLVNALAQEKTKCEAAEQKVLELNDKLHRMKDVMELREQMCYTHRSIVGELEMDIEGLKKELVQVHLSHKEEIKQIRKRDYEKLEAAEDLILKLRNELAVKDKFIKKFFTHSAKICNTYKELLRDVLDD